MLPEAITRAWSSNAQEELGGWIQLAGGDVVEVFASRSISDHPWLGLEVEFPFVEVGKGKITRCLTHPKGELMFDVVFEVPVPPIHGYPGRYEVALKDYPAYHRYEHRFMASMLQNLC